MADRLEAVAAGHVEPSVVGSGLLIGRGGSSSVSSSYSSVRSVRRAFPSFGAGAWRVSHPMAQSVPPSRNRVGAEVPPSDDPLIADTGVDDAETAGAGRRDTRSERPKDRSAGDRVRVTRPDSEKFHT